MKHKHFKKLKRPGFSINKIALVFIVLVLVVFTGFYKKSKEGMQIDAEKIAKIMLDNRDMSFVSNGVIDEKGLQEMQKTDYVELKSQLNAKNDFCMYIEDADGNIIVAKGSARFKAEFEICIN